MKKGDVPCDTGSPASQLMAEFADEPIDFARVAKEGEQWFELEKRAMLRSRVARLRAEIPKLVRERHTSPDDVTLVVAHHGLILRLLGEDLDNAESRFVSSRTIAEAQGFWRPGE